jgi:hypothetical protein
MNLEKKVKKLMEEGYKDSEKDKEKMLEVLLFYAKSHDMKINYARLTYECIFNLNCREAEELNIDLWVHLSTKFKIPGEERYLIKPPNELKNKKKRQDCIKWLFYPFFFEWKFNNFTNPITYAFSKDLLTLREGGKKRGEQETQGKITRQEIIIQIARELDVKKLLADGMMKKDIDKLVADAIPEEKKKKAAGIQCVRKLLKSQNYNLYPQ